MAVEERRQCGYRTVGGIYLVCDGEGLVCDRLPFDIATCPTCGHGPKPTRSFSWLPNPREMFGGDCERCLCPVGVCPACNPTDGHQGLIWLGSSHYSAQEWHAESAQMGVSRKISGVPKDFEIGTHWVYVAEREKAEKFEKTEHDGHITLTIVEEGHPARIVSAFKPERIEIIITKSMSEDERIMARIEKRGLTPVVVPDDDADHNPHGYDKLQGKLQLDKKLGKEGT